MNASALSECTTQPGATIENVHGRLPVSSLYVRRTTTSRCAAYVGSFSVLLELHGGDHLILGRPFRDLLLDGVSGVDEYLPHAM